MLEKKIPIKEMPSKDQIIYFTGNTACDKGISKYPAKEFKRIRYRMNEKKRAKRFNITVSINDCIQI